MGYENAGAICEVSVFDGGFQRNLIVENEVGRIE